MSGLDEALSQDNIPKHLVQVSTEHMFHLLETRLNLKSAWNKQEPKEAAVPNLAERQRGGCQASADVHRSESPAGTVTVKDSPPYETGRLFKFVFDLLLPVH